MAIAGVYVIFGPQNRVYVGESADVLRRKTLSVSRSLGLDWNIVRYMTGSGGSQRSKVEHRVMAAYARAGYSVVSNHKGAHGGIRRGTAAHARRWSLERRAEHAARMRVVMNKPEQLRDARQRMTRMNAARSKEERTALARLTWATRRRNGTDKVQHHRNRVKGS